MPSPLFGFPGLEVPVQTVTNRDEIPFQELPFEDREALAAIADKLQDLHTIMIPDDTSPYYVPVQQLMMLLLASHKRIYQLEARISRLQIDMVKQEEKKKGKKKKKK